MAHTEILRSMWTMGCEQRCILDWVLDSGAGHMHILTAPSPTMSRNALGRAGVPRTLLRPFVLRSIVGDDAANLYSWPAPVEYVQSEPGVVHSRVPKLCKSLYVRTILSCSSGPMHYDSHLAFRSRFGPQVGAPKSQPDKSNRLYKFARASWGRPGRAAPPSLRACSSRAIARRRGSTS